MLTACPHGRAAVCVTVSLLGGQHGHANGRVTVPPCERQAYATNLLAQQKGRPFSGAALGYSSIGGLSRLVYA